MGIMVETTINVFCTLSSSPSSKLPSRDMASATARNQSSHTSNQQSMRIEMAGDHLNSSGQRWRGHSRNSIIELKANFQLNPFYHVYKASQEQEQEKAPASAGNI